MIGWYEGAEWSLSVARYTCTHLPLKASDTACTLTCPLHTHTHTHRCFKSAHTGTLGTTEAVAVTAVTVSKGAPARLGHPQGVCLCNSFITFQVEWHATSDSCITHRMVWISCPATCDFFSHLLINLKLESSCHVQMHLWTGTYLHLTGWSSSHSDKIRVKFNFRLTQVPVTFIPDPWPGNAAVRFPWQGPQRISVWLVFLNSPAGWSAWLTQAHYVQLERSLWQYKNMATLGYFTKEMSPALICQHFSEKEVQGNQTALDYLLLLSAFSTRIWGWDTPLEAWLASWLSWKAHWWPGWVWT